MPLFWSTPTLLMHLTPLFLRADEMGVGKTAICLALILSTLGEAPSLDNVSSYLDGSPSPPPVVLTDKSLRFPFAAYIKEVSRSKARLNPPLPGWDPDAKELREYEEQKARQDLEDATVVGYPLPTLRDLCFDKIRKSSSRIIDERNPLFALDGQFYDEWNMTWAYYQLHPSIDQSRSRTGRRAASSGDPVTTRILLSRASLIVVPTDLVRQWASEIEKHFTPSTFRTLLLLNKKDVLPPLEDFDRYDIVLLSIARFSDFANDPDCVLRRVHWVRLIVDEGHVLSGDNNMRKLAGQVLQLLLDFSTLTLTHQVSLCSFDAAQDGQFQGLPPRICEVCLEKSQAAKWEKRASSSLAAISRISRDLRTSFHGISSIQPFPNQKISSTLLRLRFSGIDAVQLDSQLP